MEIVFKSTSIENMHNTSNYYENDITLNPLMADLFKSFSPSDIFTQPFHIETFDRSFIENDERVYVSLKMQKVIILVQRENSQVRFVHAMDCTSNTSTHSLVPKVVFLP